MKASVEKRFDAAKRLGWKNLRNGVDGDRDVIIGDEPSDNGYIKDQRFPELATWFVDQILNTPRCTICNTVHSDGRTCQIETLENCLRAKQVEPDGADKVIAHLNGELGFWEAFGRAVAKEVGCLISVADPRPEHGNAHVIAAIVALKNQLEAIKARNIINAIKEICADCGHTLDENNECANCWQKHCEELHAEFGHLYSACRTFIKDWRDGDFQLPRLAEIHAEQIETTLARPPASLQGYSQTPTNAAAGHSKL